MSLKQESQISSIVLAEINSQVQARITSFYAGLAEYANATIPDWNPADNGTRLVGEIGASKLYDYGGQGEVVVVVPPLINRANIMDLSEKMSFVRNLAKTARVYLLDWGVASADEKGFLCADYAARLQQFLQNLGKVHLLGYCMGGIVAIQAASAQQDNINSLILVATPWDFSYLKDKIFTFKDFVANYQGDFVPAQIIQSLFFGLDIWGVINKFSKLPERNLAEKQDFFLVEKWVNNGVDMPASLFRECILDWVISGNSPCDASAIKKPVLLACPKNDKIVPLASSMAVAQNLENCTIKQFDCGHIGLVTKDYITPALQEWIR